MKDCEDSGHQPGTELGCLNLGCPAPVQQHHKQISHVTVRPPTAPLSAKETVLLCSGPQPGRRHCVYEGNLTPLRFFFKTTRFLQSENSENCIVETFEYNQHFDMQN